MLSSCLLFPCGGGKKKYNKGTEREDSIEYVQVRRWDMSSAYEVKDNYCLFERVFTVKTNGVFLFGISFFVLEIFTFL